MKNVRGALWSRILFVFVLMATGVGILRATQEVDQPLNRVNVHVQDQDSRPVAGANIEIRLWAGSGWKETNCKAETGADGAFVFEDVNIEGYAAVLVTHSGHSSLLQDFSFERGKSSTVSCMLLPPMISSIQVLAPDGKPLAGAEISRLTVSNPKSGVKMVLGNTELPMFGGGAVEDFQSDESGRIQLPPLPSGSVVSVEVNHPEWRTGKLAEVELSDLQNTTVVLEKGTIVTSRFFGDSATLSELEGKRVRVLFSSGPGRYRIVHSHVIRDGSITFCVEPGQYSGLSVYLEGFSLTPSIPGNLESVEFANIEVADRIERRMFARRRHPARGRVVNGAGKPVAGATVMAESENLYADANGNPATLPYFEWDTNLATTDANGFYDVQLPYGKTKIRVEWSDYYSDPDSRQLVFDHETQLPDHIVKPYPVIAGTVVDENQKPVAGAVVRPVTYFGESEYLRADGNGEFRMKVEQFEFDPIKKERKLSRDLIAFDPYGNLCSITTVDLKDATTVKEITLEMERREPEWLLGELGTRSKQYWVDYGREPFQGIPTAPEPGSPGNMAPEFESGSWINTSATSLNDFRGQYVLLDFWFIGCGPCERDFPSVKLVHELYSQRGFTVLSVHIAGQTPESVKQFSDARKMNYPLVVDGVNETILNAYRPFGVNQFPSYILIGPDGKVVRNDQAHSDDATLGFLRGEKIEVIRQLMLTEK